MNKRRFPLESIGIIHSPYKQKFAIPRQPRLVEEAVATLQFLPPYDNADIVRGLEQFSHLWLLFLFHQNLDQGWTPTIRPPRMGGNKKIGVFASRSTFRPNGIGMSAVRLLAVKHTSEGPRLELGGVDLLDQTPVVDIKPYIPYSDIIKDADGGFAEHSPDANMTVVFSDKAHDQCQEYEKHYPALQKMIEKILAQDPRPAYKQKSQDDKIYSAELYDLDVRWRVDGQQTLVLTIDDRG